MADRDLARLARVAKRRRLQLGLARNKAAVAIGISKDTWARLEAGEPIREMNYAKIDIPLGWAVGSCVAVLEGGEPTEVEVTGEGAISSVATSDLGSEIAKSMAHALVGTTTSLPNEEIRELTAQVLKDLENRGLI